MTDTTRIALVTGANKGIDFEVAKQLAEAGLAVLVGARDTDRGEAAAGKLFAQGLDVSFIQLDVRDADSVAAAAARIGAEHGRLDILINNAGINVEGGDAPSGTDLDAVRLTLETNFIGPLAVTQAMLPLLRKSPAARIVNMSSSLGSLAINNDPGHEWYGVSALGYSASKAALNMLTVRLGAELRDTGITVAAACPGLVRTDLSGNMGDRLPAQGAAAAVRLALNSEGGMPEFRDANGKVPW